METSLTNFKPKLNWKQVHLLLDSWAHDVPRDAFGVYVIWLRLPNGKMRTIRVGQGRIYYRLLEHRKDRKIIRNYKVNRILATWARVQRKNADGVERWLGITLKPRVCERLPQATMIKVSLPYDNIYIPSIDIILRGLAHSLNGFSIREKLALLALKYLEEDSNQSSSDTTKGKIKLPAVFSLTNY